LVLSLINPIFNNC